MNCRFEWINEPAICFYENNALSVITDYHTDFWRRTWYGIERFTGHIYATDVTDDFTFQVRIRADFTTLYDQAGIMMLSVTNSTGSKLAPNLTMEHLQSGVYSRGEIPTGLQDSFPRIRRNSRCV